MNVAGADERVVELRGRGLGDGTRRILELAERLGYAVVAAGPGSYRLARSRRRLTGKHTESVLVSVYDDRGGTKARFVGPVDAALLQRLNDDAQPVANAPSVSPPDSSSFSWSSANSAGTTVSQPVAAAPGGPSAAYPPGMPPPVERPAPRPTPSPAGGLIASVPGAPPRPLAPPAPTATPAHVETADLDERTIVNLRREPPAPTQPAEPGLVLPGGTFISLTTPVVIGRDPDPTRGAPGAVPVPVAEPSLSKTHLAVACRDGHIHVTDLHSSNGTIVEVATIRTPCAPGVEVAVPRGAALIAGALVIEVAGP